MPRSVVLVPTYNEATNIREFHRSFREHCDHDLLVIDDSSPDGTAELVRQIASEDPGVRLLLRPGKEGLGKAYAEGFGIISSEGRYDRVFMMDADLSHQPSHLPALAEALDRVHMSIGSRYIHGVSVLNWSILRLNLSYTANWYIRTATGLPVRDCTSGFRGFRAEVLPVLLSSEFRASGYAFLVEMLHRVWMAGMELGEVPIVFLERRSGSSKISRRVLLESLLLPLRLVPGRFRRRRAPGRSQSEL